MAAARRFDDAGVELALVLTCGTGRDEVVLDHRQPAVVGGLDELRLVLLDVVEGDFLVLLFAGIDRGSGKGETIFLSPSGATVSRWNCSRRAARAVSGGVPRDFVADIDLVAARDGKV